jgi:hypothetical protein
MDMPMPMPTANNHGFSLLGETSLVLSHIPMFMPPHQAQLFLTVTLTGSDGQNPVELYLKDLRRAGSTDYVLVSDPLVLIALAPHAPQPLHTFTGKIYRGWPFNNPNTAPLVADNVTVHVTRSLYFQDITKDRPVQSLTYLAFETPETDYVIHKLVQPADLKTAPTPPGFVQVLSGKLSPLRHETFEEVTFPDLSDDPAHRLQAGQTAAGKAGAEYTRVSVTAELIYDPNHLI